ncbi:LPXTG-motif cell wall anchor domain protein [Listeria grayi DSM 20601]|uniref:LPXTG-motif cell wall anchor domain protein n=1 Tax=Listeria grayi DSM 20601 TaxID=525367 RepID=D7UY71_LISGR|nr:LPXTG-motif cell wall anchor domain protein [Listeria grayi DSM 20601]
MLEKLAHGHPVSVSFEVTVSEAASGEITNIATGKVPGNDETPEDNQKVDVPVTPSLKKTASVQEAKLGDTYEYQIEVGNEAGGGKWNNIAIRDQLPAELSYVAGSTKVNGQAVSDDAWAAGKYEATIASLASGAKQTITYKVQVKQVPASGVLTNEVSAAGEQSDGKAVAATPASVDVKINKQEPKPNPSPDPKPSPTPDPKPNPAPHNNPDTKPHSEIKKFIDSILPKTGDQFLWMYTIIGLLLIATAIYVWKRKRK